MRTLHDIYVQDVREPGLRLLDAADPVAGRLAVVVLLMTLAEEAQAAIHAARSTAWDLAWGVEPAALTAAPEAEGVHTITEARQA